MTTILTYQGDGFAVVASDTRVVGKYKDSGVRKVEKVGTYLLGAAGHVRAMNILHHAFKPPVCKDSLHGKALDGFITATFIPALRGAFDMYGYSTPNTHVEAQHLAQQESDVVVVVNGAVYIISCNYDWTRPKGRVGGVGSGSGFGMGALEVLLRGKRKPSILAVKSAMLGAMKTAHRFDEFTSAPFHVHVQKR